MSSRDGERVKRNHIAASREPVRGRLDAGTMSASHLAATIVTAGEIVVNGGGPQVIR